MQINETQLDSWSSNLGKTEDEKCRNAIERISNILQKKFGTSIYLTIQGSYLNNTNIKSDSDVDIVAQHTGYVYHDTSFLSPADKEIYLQNFKGSSYTFLNYKDQVEEALKEEFGYADVKRGNKCINVVGNSYRINADVVPCFTHRRLKTPYHTLSKGIEFRTDSGEKIISFPQQHYNSGEEKNEYARLMYKPIVRIIKNIRNELEKKGKIAEDLVSSFMIECLVWNVMPHTHFHERTYGDALKNVLETIYSDMNNPEAAVSYAEVSKLKWLFKGNSHRSPQKISKFTEEAWSFIGY